MITLATLKDATAQEVFDQAARHLLTQRQKASVGSSCVYRLVKGETLLKCGGGCFISDEEYKPEFEGIVWPIHIGITPERKGINAAPEAHRSLIRLIQLLHDSIPVENWAHQLKLVAGQHELSSAVVDSMEALHGAS